MKSEKEKGKKAENDSLKELDLISKHTCKNCGHVDTGKFCSACGQSFTEYKRPLKEILNDFFSIFSLDSSIFKTIGPFLFKPGFISREYLNGRRKTYMSPLRLYIFLSIVFFFVASKTSINSSGLSNASFTLGNDSISSELVLDEAFIESLKNDTSFVVVQGDTIYRDSVSSAFNEKLIESAERIIANPTLYLSNFFQNISYSLFILMPMCALILQLLYLRRKHYYVEHLIFTLNVHSFTLLVLTILVLLQYLFKENYEFTVILALIIPVYLVAGMKRFYQQKFWKTLLKSMIIGGLYSLLIAVAILGIVFLTFISNYSI